MPMLSLGTDGGGLAPATALASVTLTVPAGAYIAISGQDVVLSIAGQTLQADVTFTQATAADGTRTVTVALSDGHLQLTGLPEITFTGVLVSTASGVAGSLTLSVANLAIGDATLTGDTGAVFKLLLNSGATAQVVTLPDLSVVRVPAGPYLRIEVSGVLTVGGASISGTFGIEQVTTTGGVKRTVLAVSGASVRLSATGPDLLQNVTGALVVLPTGIAAQVSGSINLAGVLPASVTVQGSFSLSINRTGAAVSETLTLGGTTVSVDVPAGPFVRVAATGSPSRSPARRSPPTSRSSRTAPRRCCWSSRTSPCGSAATPRCSASRTAPGSCRSPAPPPRCWPAGSPARSR